MCLFKQEKFPFSCFGNSLLIKTQRLGAAAGLFPVSKTHFRKTRRVYLKVMDASFARQICRVLTVQTVKSFMFLFQSSVVSIISLEGRERKNNTSRQKAACPRSTAPSRKSTADSAFDLLQGGRCAAAGGATVIMCIFNCMETSAADEPERQIVQRLAKCHGSLWWPERRKSQCRRGAGAVAVTHDTLDK